MEKSKDMDERSSTIAMLKKIMPSGTPKALTTDKLAEFLEVKPGTIRRGLCVNGHYAGLIPERLPSRRLIFLID